MILTEKEFLSKFQLKYGYGNKINKLRKEEFSRLKGKLFYFCLEVCIQKRSQQKLF